MYQTRLEMSQAQKRPSRWSDSAPSPKRLHNDEEGGSCCDSSKIENETCSTSKDEVVIEEVTIFDGIGERLDVLNWALQAVEWKLQLQDDALKIAKLEELSLKFGAMEEEVKNAREGLDEERAKTVAAELLYERRVEALESKLRKCRARAGTQQLLASAHISDLQSRLQDKEEQHEELNKSLVLTEFALDSTIRGGYQKVEDAKKALEKMREVVKEKEAVVKEKEAVIQEMNRQKEKAVKFASATMESLERSRNYLEEAKRAEDGYKMEIKQNRKVISKLKKALQQSKQRDLDIEKKTEELSEKLRSSKNEDLGETEAETRGASVEEQEEQMAAEGVNNEVNEEITGEELKPQEPEASTSRLEETIVDGTTKTDLESAVGEGKSFEQGDHCPDNCEDEISQSRELPEGNENPSAVVSTSNQLQSGQIDVDPLTDAQIEAEIENVVDEAGRVLPTDAQREAEIENGLEEGEII